MTSRCGYIAIVGRPNVGKSTLINHLIKQKVSITSRKPQTTRHAILGIKTVDENQMIFVDTPGLHQGVKKSINRFMNKNALRALKDSDIVVFMVDGVNFKPDDEYVLSLVEKAKKPTFLLINKIDKVKDKKSLLPFIEEMAQKYDFTSIIPLSAKNGDQVNLFEEELIKLLPKGEHLYDAEMITNRSVKFLCAEIIREKIFRFSGQELPYSTTVEIESFKEEDKVIKIHALILVDKESHKRMIIGEKGAKLKEIASLARLDMEKLLDKKVFLQCWCKVKAGWADNENLLKQLGYEN